MIEIAFQDASASLLTALEENLHGHVAYVQSRLPGMVARDVGGLLVVDSGLPTDTFNKICRARLTDAEADERIAEAVAHFRGVGRPFSWWLGPLSRPLDLERRLTAHGLRPAEVEVGMVMDLGELSDAPAAASGLDVRRARTVREVMDFAAINAANWNPLDQAVMEFYRLAAPTLLSASGADDSPMRLFVGYDEGQAVAACELFIGGGAAGLHMVSVLESHRRRGFGSAMCLAALREARRAGLSTATLQASEQGLSLYARLGFKPCCRLVEYQ